MTKFTKIHYGSNEPYITREMHQMKPINATLVLVPDEDTLHEVQGLALIANKKLLVRVLEPGKPLPWDKQMTSPWYVNTDKYHMSFNVTDSYQSPHLLFSCL